MIRSRGVKVLPLPENFFFLLFLTTTERFDGRAAIMFRILYLSLTLHEMY